MAAANRFAKPAPTTAKKSTKVVPTHAIDGLRDLAILTSVMKQLKTLHSTVQEEVNTQMSDYFTKEGAKLKSQPVNFQGTDGDSSANCQLKKRSSRSTLSSADAELLMSLGVSVEVSPTSAFTINTAYSNDEALLEKVSVALDTVEGIPADFICAAPTAYVTTDKSIDELFATGNTKTIGKLLSLVGTLATRTKFGGAQAELLTRLNEMVGEASDDDGDHQH